MNTLFWILAWFLVSIPWFNSKIFGIYGFYNNKNAINSNKTIKPFWLTALESFVLYSLIIVVGFALESSRGARFNQGWQFWVVIVCLWVVLVFPASAWFRLKKS
jgi:hypothetical protein